MTAPPGTTKGASDDATAETPADVHGSPTAAAPGLALVRLLQLASPALPVGAYSYSQGLEAAIEAGIVVNAATAERWIGEVLAHAVAAVEAPLFCLLHRAFDRGDFAGAEALDALLLSTRETAELRAETEQMGYSLFRLLGELEGAAARASIPSSTWIPSIGGDRPRTFLAAFAFAAARWQIAEADALVAYLWAALENQVMAAMKAIPLGQTDGQRLLLGLGARLPALARAAASAASNAVGDPALLVCNFTPGLAIASSRHEAQYSRLFRS